MSFNKAAVFAVFNDADKSSASFAERLIALGLASRTDAKPLAMEWAAAKYGAKLVEGQRGLTFAKRNTDAERAMYRVLQVCFPSADLARSKTSNNKADPVAKLLKAYNELSVGQKRSFLAKLGK